MADIEAIIADAYDLDQGQKLHSAALQRIRDAVQDGETKTALLDEVARLGEVVRARSMGGRCGCHVSKVCHDLLTEALVDALMG